MVNEKNKNQKVNSDGGRVLKRKDLCREKHYHKCGECPEVTGNVWQGYVYCKYLNQDVWANSMQCPHGDILRECF